MPTSATYTVPLSKAQMPPKELESCRCILHGGINMELVVMVKHPLSFSNVYPKGLRNISTVLYYILFTWMSKTSQHEKPIRIGMIPSDSQCQGHDCTNTLTRTPKGAAEPHKIHSMKSPNLLSARNKKEQTSIQ